MQKFLNLSFIVILFLPISLYSQSNFFEGYVVTHTGDTLKGVVLGKEGLSNPKSVKFKAEQLSAAKEYTLEDIKAFGLYNKEHFERYFVRISMGGVLLKDLSEGLDTTYKEQYAFLKMLYSGPKVSLLSYTDHIKTRYYFKEQNGEKAEELLYYVFRHPGITNKLTSHQVFREQLSGLLEKFNTGVEKSISLSRVDYNSDEIIRIISLINGGQEKLAHGETNLVKKEKFRFYVSIGAISSNAIYASKVSDNMEPLVSDKGSSSTSVSPLISMGIDFFINPAYRRTIIRTELSLFTTKSERTLHDPDENYPSYYLNHKFKQFNSLSSIKILYNLINKEKYKVYIGGGLGAQYSFTSENDLVRRPSYTIEPFFDRPPAIENFSYAFLFNAGVVLSKRMEVFVGYSITNNNTNYSDNIIKLQRCQTGLSYYF